MSRYLSQSLILPICIALLWGCSINQPDRISKTGGVAGDMRETRQSWDERVVVGGITPMRKRPLSQGPIWLFAVHGLSFSDNLSISQALDLMVQNQTWSFDPLIVDPHLRRVNGNGLTAYQTLREGLEALLIQLDWGYTIDGNHITIRDTIQRQIELENPIGERSATLTLNSLNESGGGGGQATSVTVAGSMVKDLEQALSRLSDRASKTTELPHEYQKSFSYAFPQNSTLLEISGSPSYIREAVKIVEKYNALISRRAVVDITLFEVRSDENAKTGVDVDANLNRVWGASRETIGIGQTGGAPPELAETLVTGIGAPGQYLLTASAKRPNWDATVQGVLDILRSFSDASILSQFRMEVLNGQVSNVEDVRTRDYVAKITYPRTTIGGQPESPEVEIKQIREGIALSLLPTLQTDRGHLQIALSLAELTSLVPVNIGEDRITLPTLSGPNHLVSMTLKSGQPRLATNISRRKTLTSNSRQAGLARFGNNKTSEVQEVETLMLIQMTIVSG